MSVVHDQASTEACQTIECHLSIRFCVILCRRLGSRNFLSSVIHKFIPPQAMKIPEAKAAVDKEWEKLENMSAWNLTKVRGKSEVIDEARTSGATVHFASLLNGHMSFEPKIQRSSCAPR